MTDLIQCGRTYVHNAHGTDAGRCPGLHQQASPSPNPWRERPTYEQLEAGLRVIASDADVRGDHHVAAYAHLALAGEPFPVDCDDDAEDHAPRVYAGDRREVAFMVDRLPDTGVLLLPGHGPDAESLTASDVRTSTGYLTLVDADRVLLQVGVDRTAPYWSDRQDVLAAVEAWAGSLRDSLGGA